MGTFVQQGEIPGVIAKRWCIDPARITFAGHSDGGSSAAAVAFFGKSSPLPAAIAVSGAGMRKQDITDYACPAPVSVLVVHSRNDSRFPLPEFGKGPAQWWADCNHCASPPVAAGEGCVEHTGCRAGRRVRYCETSSAHQEWPPASEEILRFLVSARAPAR
jgi:polyhydroxybutyrate depolymerase